ncbi:MAG: imidazole glycerol phosphate synthase subunit HisH [Anaerolineales bacterium]|jgi:glutamine amidotransferase
MQGDDELMGMIALVDSGIGNLRSVEKALTTVGAVVERTSDPPIILEAEKVVLPGVGAFGDGMAGLEARGLIEPIKAIVARGTPLLGICVGMQVFFEESEEHGRHAGLGFLAGAVKRFETRGLTVPQTGWNQVNACRENPLLDGLPPGVYAYFNHSYYCDARPEDMLAETEYGVRYCSVVGCGALYGVQFHPEKSQKVGLTILRNFVEKC